MKIYIIKREKITRFVELNSKKIINNVLKDKFKEVYIKFTNNKEIKKINKAIFSKNTSTDVITLSYQQPKDYKVGEIFISVEEAVKNSKKFDLSTDTELLILLTHGALHLKGLNDKTKKEKIKINRLTLKNLKKLL